MRVLVTGANGFVGRAVVGRLLAQGHGVVAATRRPAAGGGDQRVSWHAVGEVDAATDWSHALAGVDGVIHLVARTHQAGEGADAQDLYWAVNVEGTRRLAAQARAAGVGRLLYVSSVKAQAERTHRPLREDDPPRPEDIYGQTKLEAERALADALADSGTRYTVLRPPLVYGPGVQANLRQLACLTLAGWPLPFGRVDNQRSLIAVRNLADLAVHALSDPRAADRTYLAADGVDLSTPDLVRRIARAGDRRARLLPVPVGWLALALRLLGRSGMADRLLGSLCVDMGRVGNELGWRPPVTVDQEMAAMVNSLRAETTGEGGS